MNNKNVQTRGTVRIFLAPKFDEQGKEFKFSETRLLMMEMDRYEVNCEFNRKIDYIELFSDLKICLFQYTLVRM